MTWPELLTVLLFTTCVYMYGDRASEWAKSHMWTYECWQAQYITCEGCYNSHGTAYIYTCTQRSCGIKPLVVNVWHCMCDSRIGRVPAIASLGSLDPAAFTAATLNPYISQDGMSCLKMKLVVSSSVSKWDGPFIVPFLVSRGVMVMVYVRVMFG